MVAIGHEIVLQAFHHGFGAFFDVDDGVLVVRIKDRKQKIKIKATNGDNVIEREYGLGSLKLKANA